MCGERIMLRQADKIADKYLTCLAFSVFVFHSWPVKITEKWPYKSFSVSWKSAMQIIATKECDILYKKKVQSPQDWFVPLTNYRHFIVLV